jgi:hypothetical protein
MLKHSASSSPNGTPPDPQVPPPERILPPPGPPPPFLDPGRRDPRRIDDPPHDPGTEPPTRPDIMPPGRGLPFIEGARRARDASHVQHYRALERRQTRAPHLLRVDTWHPLGFRIARATRIARA